GELFEPVQILDERGEPLVDELSGGAIFELCGAKDRDEKSGHGSEVRDIKRGVGGDDPAVDREDATCDVATCGRAKKEGRRGDIFGRTDRAERCALDEALTHRFICKEFAKRFGL